MNSIRLKHVNKKTKKQIMEKKLTKSNDKMIAGVCSGIAEYFGWDITIFRIIYTVASVFTAFSGVILYIILWIIMPQKNPNGNYEERLNSKISEHKQEEETK